MPNRSRPDTDRTETGLDRTGDVDGVSAPIAAKDETIEVLRRPRHHFQNDPTHARHRRWRGREDIEYHPGRERPSWGNCRIDVDRVTLAGWWPGIVWPSGVHRLGLGEPERHPVTADELVRPIGEGASLDD